MLRGWHLIVPAPLLPGSRCGTQSCACCFTRALRACTLIPRCMPHHHQITAKPLTQDAQRRETCRSLNQRSVGHSSALGVQGPVAGTSEAWPPALEGSGGSCSGSGPIGIPCPPLPSQRSECRPGHVRPFCWRAVILRSVSLQPCELQQAMLEHVHLC